MDNLVDSHCHLNFPEILSQIEEVLQAAKQANVTIMQTVCTKNQDLEDIYQLINQYDNIYGSVGLHPNHAHEEAMDLNFLLQKSQHQKIIGIGETGLDYYRKSAEEIARLSPIQQASFLNHIEAARELNLGLIVHSRDAERDTLDILKSQIAKSKFNVVLHCFTGSLEFALAAIDIGAYISFSGVITFKNAQYLRDIARQIPLSRILIETDSPYLAPVPYRGKTNQPSYVLHVAETIAAVRNISMQDVAKTTTENFFKVFPRAAI